MAWVNYSPGDLVRVISTGQVGTVNSTSVDEVVLEFPGSPINRHALRSDVEPVGAR